MLTLTTYASYQVVTVNIKLNYQGTPHANFNHSSHLAAACGCRRLQAGDHADAAAADPLDRRDPEADPGRPPGGRRGQAALRERSVVPRRRQAAGAPGRCRRDGQAGRHARRARHAGLPEPPALGGSRRQRGRGRAGRGAGQRGSPRQAVEERLHAARRTTTPRCATCAPPRRGLPPPRPISTSRATSSTTPS